MLKRYPCKKFVFGVMLYRKNYFFTYYLNFFKIYNQFTYSESVEIGKLSVIYLTFFFCNYTVKFVFSTGRFGFVGFQKDLQCQNGLGSAKFQRDRGDLCAFIFKLNSQNLL